MFTMIGLSVMGMIAASIFFLLGAVWAGGNRD